MKIQMNFLLMIFTIIVLQVWKRFEINTLPGLFSNLIAFGLIGWYWRK